MSVAGRDPRRLTAHDRAALSQRRTGRSMATTLNPMTPISEGQPGVTIVRRPGRWAWIRAGWTRLGRSTGAPNEVRRLLFLDDDPSRAEVFLKDHPDAVWVTTVPECLAHLAEPWDEVHLDHDLGGKMFVDSKDTDCGMEVIRWLCKEPRDHLKDSHFFVHTHNATAGLLMVLQMRGGGYNAEFRPFGLDLQRLLEHNEPAAGSEQDEAPPPQPPPQLARRLLASWRTWVGRLGGRV